MDAIKQQNELFAQTKPINLFFRAAIPGAIGMAASNIYYISEALMVGQILGELCFTAMQLATPLILINFAIMDLVGVGSSVHLAIRLGEGREDEANKMFSFSLIFMFILASILSLILCVGAPYFFRWMGAEEDVVKLATDYLRVYAIMTPLGGFAFAFDNYLRICGKIRFSMFLNIFMAVISAIIEFTLLFFMRLPLPFAAFGSCLGMIIAVVIAVIPFARGKMTLRFVKPKVNPSMVKDILSAGTPVFMSNMAGRIFSILMNFLLMRFGGNNAVSIYGIVMNTEGIVLPLLYGMCDSLQPAIGYNLGSGRIKRVRALERCCFIASAVVSITFAFLMIFFPANVVKIFMGNNVDEVFLKTGAIAVILFGLNYFVRWIAYASQSFFSAIGKTKHASALSLLSCIVLPLVAIPILWPLGENGLYLNASLTALISSLFALTLMYNVLKGLRRDEKAELSTNLK